MSIEFNACFRLEEIKHKNVNIRWLNDIKTNKATYMVLRGLGKNRLDWVGHLKMSSKMGLNFLKMTVVTLKLRSNWFSLLRISSLRLAMSIQFFILLKKRTKLKVSRCKQNSQNHKSTNLMLQHRRIRVSETMLPSILAALPIVWVVHFRQDVYTAQAIQSIFSP